MSRTDRDLERIRELLREKLRESGVAHWQVEAALGWDRGHIGELLADVRRLQVDELLRILDVIRVAPEDFLSEIYGPLENRTPASGNGSE